MTVCTATTRAGRPCANPACRGDQLCGPHRRQVARRTHTLTIVFHEVGWFEVHADGDPAFLGDRLLDLARMLANEPGWARCIAGRCGHGSHVG